MAMDEDINTSVETSRVDTSPEDAISVEALLHQLERIEAQIRAGQDGSSDKSAPDGLLDVLNRTQAAISAQQAELEELKAEASHHETLSREQRHRLEKSAKQRRILERAIQDAEYAMEVLSSLIDTMPIGVIVARADGMILSINEAAEEILEGRITGTAYNPNRHYTIHTTTGQPFPNEEMPLCRALAHGEVTKDLELHLRKASGKESILLTSAAPVTDARGDTIGAVTVFRDVTQQRHEATVREALLADLQAEQERVVALTTALESERDVLEAVMENTYTHLAYLDSNFDFVRVNAAYVRGSGYTREELIGHNHFDLFPDQENERIFKRVVETGEPVSFHAKPFTFPDRPEEGTSYWDWTLVPITGEEGEVEGLVFSLLDVTERYRSEMEIESLARFPSENPDPVLRVDEDGKLIYANASSAKLLETWQTRVGQRIPDHWFTQVQAAIEEQTIRNFEVTGDGFVLALTAAPSEDGYANLYGSDITDLRRAQRSLRLYAARLRILHEIDQAILSAESMEDVAAAALARLPELINTVRTSVTLFDFNADELVVLAVQTNDGQTQAGKGWRSSLKENDSYHMKRLKRGQEVWVKDVTRFDWGLPLIDVLRTEGVRSLLHQPLMVDHQLIGTLDLALARPGNVPRGLIELARELGDQLAIAIHQARLHRRIHEHAEQLERRVAWRTAALRISEARFRAIFEDAPTGIALLDHEGHIIQANTALERILRQGADELRETALRDHMHADDATKALDLYDSLMNGAEERFRTEARFIRPGTSKEPVWCTVTVSLVRDVEHQPRLAIGMVEDITERRKAQAALVQTEKLALTGQLAASLAHEINNPLQTVIGCLGLADETVGEEEPVGTYLQMASDELKRAAGIVGRLRDLNRRSHPEEKEQVQMRDIMDHIIAVTSKQCLDRHVNVVLNEEDDLPPVNIVPDRIQQVFLNLILNAIDAMPQGGTLSVDLTRTDHPEGVRVQFRDTGVGIDLEDQARLFDPFYTTKPEGLGLGLFISQSIIEDHGGRIAVESQPGVGTTFTIWLPV